MKKPPVIIECPCYRVCSRLSVKLGAWCRYDKEAVPNPGMHRFDPQEAWCPGGVQANVLLLGYMLAGRQQNPESLKPALERVREWARTLRQEPHRYDPTGERAQERE